MSDIKIPDWYKCSDRVNDGTASPLEEFIFENEPSGVKGEVRFRKGLRKLLIHMMKGEPDNV